MVQKANTVFRDYVTDMVPSSGVNDPDKVEIRKWGTYVESGIAGAAAGATIYASKVDMDADTSQAANAMAWVLGDATAANNGVYQFDGTSTWTRLGDLPYSYIKASNAGAGTADAIVATTSIPIPEADGAALIALPIVADNTSATVTVAFNGDDALTIKTNAGNSPAVGGLKSGTIIAGYVSGTTFRLLSDQASAAVLAACVDAQTAAEAAAASIDYLVVADRAVLKAVDTSAHTAIYLREAGREGIFKWDSSDLSAKVTIDTAEGIYVAPTNDATGASGAWVRQFDGAISAAWFGATGDGTTDDKAAFVAWMAYLCAIGGSGFVPGGTYSLASGVGATLNASVKIDCSSDAEFVAAEGFPHTRMFLISPGTVAAVTFEWIGGQFDASNQPNSDAGESNDIFSFNATNADSVKIVLDRTYSGEDWLNAGSDAHLFVGAVANIHAEIRSAKGSVDSAIYISGPSDGTGGHSLYAFINAEKCGCAIICKRKFDLQIMEAITVDCLNGVGTGPASLSDASNVPGGDGTIVRVNALRTERPAFIQGSNGAIIEVNAMELGVSITGYSSTTAYALYCSGGARVKGTVNAWKVNPALTKSASYQAVRCDQRTIDSTDYNATDNDFDITADDIGCSFSEQNSNCARNHFRVKENNVSLSSATVGEDSTIDILSNISGSTRRSISADLIALGAAAGLGESVQIARIPSAVNFIDIRGAITAGSCGVTFTGSDTNVSGYLATRGLGRLMLGSSAGSESLSVEKVASQVNAVTVTGAVSGSPVKVGARGSNTDVGLQLTPKGSARVSVPVANVPDYADDTAAAGGGVAIGELYRNGSVLMIRAA